MIPLLCPYCSKPAQLCTGTQVYPHRPDLRRAMFWRCEPCKAWVGCHPKTVTPLGRLANAELRRAKQQVHAVLDVHWRGQGKRARTAVYKRLGKDLGITSALCHVGEFDVATCERAIAVINHWAAPAALPPREDEHVH